MMIDLTGRQLGNYRIIKLLGEDGFASMYTVSGHRLRVQRAERISFCDHRQYISGSSIPQFQLP